MTIRTRLDGAMYVGPGLVVDPIEAGLDGQPGEHAVLGAVAVARRHVDRSALVV